MTKSISKVGCLVLALILLLLPGCASEPVSVSWGSFTPDPTYSYDGKYYAVQEVDRTFEEAVGTIKVCIYDAETDALISYFHPARARDFWGICWENDTYNIWTQSADIGIYCYKYEDGQWTKDESAIRPDYIVSKYDKDD